jgi:hypothetical protein
VFGLVLIKEKLEVAADSGNGGRGGAERNVGCGEPGNDSLSNQTFF